MDVLRVLDEMEEQVESSTRIPMTGKVVIEHEVLLDFIDKMRSVLPEQLRQAQWVTKERDRIIVDAEEEAKQIVSKARNQVRELAEETEIVKEAYERTEEVLREAEQKAAEIRQGANDYAFEVLRGLEDTMSKTLNVVRKGQDELKYKDKKEENSLE